MSVAKLSQADIHRLLVDRSSRARIETMAKVMADFEGGRFSPHERAVVAEIVRRLAIDAEQAVREAVAWQICRSPLLTPDLAERLANDMGAVAFPVLRHAESLSPDFLVSVILYGDPRKQMAIAARDEVPAAVSDALVDSANVKAIERLMRNPGAALAEATLDKALDHFGVIGPVAESMAGRRDLSRRIVECLVQYVGEEIRDELIARHGLPEDVVRPALERGREAAMVLLLPPLAPGPVDLMVLARRLHEGTRLTPALLFRALCSGDVGLFVAGLAVQCGVGIMAAQRLAFDEGPLGLTAAFARAGIPPELLPPFRAAIGAARKLDHSDRRVWQRNIVAAVFNACHNSPDRMVDDLLLSLFDHQAEEIVGAILDDADPARRASG